MQQNNTQQDREPQSPGQVNYESGSEDLKRVGNTSQIQPAPYQVETQQEDNQQIQVTDTQISGLVGIDPLQNEEAQIQLDQMLDVNTSQSSSEEDNSDQIDLRQQLDANQSQLEQSEAISKKVAAEIDQATIAAMKSAIAAVDTDDAPMPLIKTGVSIAVDLKLGWKPKNPYSGAPIPLYYDYEEFEGVTAAEKDKNQILLYLGLRPINSVHVHKEYSRQKLEDGSSSYNFKFPPRPVVIQKKRVEEPRDFLGMNPELLEELKEKYDASYDLRFDSNFESGNLDYAFRTKNLRLDQSVQSLQQVINYDVEYSAFMRVDTNTRGHHQWFYFSVEYKEWFKGKTVNFKIKNFTKEDSLYGTGMRIVISKKSNGYKWTKGGEDIIYQPSEHLRRKHRDPLKNKFYYELSFNYKFNEKEDKIFFAYCYPYTFSKLQQFLKEMSMTKALISKGYLQNQQSGKCDFFVEHQLCKSLSGVDVPLITITSRLTSDPQEYNLIKMKEFDDHESRVSIPMYKKKKVVIITGRVHPGESNSSWMMQGFIKSLMGNSTQAQELRKRIIFKIIPMINVDGVIVGNYRTSMSGNDLNRRYLEPDSRLHPEVWSIKALVSDLIYGKTPDIGDEMAIPDGPLIQDEDIMAYVDMHGHSRKKNVFIYGPQFPLSSDKYYRTRIIPKLLSEETEKFRYHSCQFKYEHEKRKTARIVLSKEFNIMNCYTLEASFHSHFDSMRNNYEFTHTTFEEMGENLVNSLYEYTLITEEEQRQKQLKEMEKKKRKKQMQLVREQFSHKLQAKRQLEKQLKQQNKEIREHQLKEQMDLNKKEKQEFQVQITKRKLVQKNKHASSNSVVSDERSGSPQISSRRVLNTVKNKKKKVSALPPNVKDNIHAIQLESEIIEEKSEAPVPKSDGIRNFKDILGLLQKDDEIHEEQMMIEEEELGFVPDKEDPVEEFEPKFDQSQSGVDSNQSDDSDGELGGKDRQDLFSDIFSAIKEFSKQYNGNTSYNQQERYATKKKEEAKKLHKKRKLKENSEVQVSQSINQTPNKLTEKDKQKQEKAKKLITSVSPVKLDRLNQNRQSNVFKKKKEFDIDSQKTMNQLVKKDVNLLSNHQIPTFASQMSSIGNGRQVAPKAEQNESKLNTFTQQQFLSKKQQEAEKEMKLAQRQKIAQQGLLNRIGMRAQAMKTIPQQSFLFMKYTQNVQQPKAEGVLSPLVVNKIYTNQMNQATNFDNAYGAQSFNTQNQPSYRKIQKPGNSQMMNKQNRMGKNINQQQQDILDSDNVVRHGGNPFEMNDFEESNQIIENYIKQKFGFDNVASFNPQQEDNSYKHTVADFMTMNNHYLNGFDHENSSNTNNAPPELSMTRQIQQNKEFRIKTNSKMNSNNVSNKKSSGVISTRDNPQGAKPNSQYYKQRQIIDHESEVRNGKDSPNSMFMNYRQNQDDNRYDLHNRSRNRHLNTNQEGLESEPDLEKLSFPKSRKQTPKNRLSKSNCNEREALQIAEIEQNLQISSSKCLRDSYTTTTNAKHNNFNHLISNSDVVIPEKYPRSDISIQEKHGHVSSNYQTQRAPNRVQMKDIMRSMNPATDPPNKSEHKKKYNMTLNQFQIREQHTDYQKYQIQKAIKQTKYGNPNNYKNQFLEESGQFKVPSSGMKVTSINKNQGPPNLPQAHQNYTVQNSSSKKKRILGLNSGGLSSTTSNQNQLSPPQMAASGVYPNFSNLQKSQQKLFLTNNSGSRPQLNDSPQRTGIQDRLSQNQQFGFTSGAPHLPQQQQIPPFQSNQMNMRSIPVEVPYSSSSITFPNLDPNRTQGRMPIASSFIMKPPSRPGAPQNQGQSFPTPNQQTQNTSYSRQSGENSKSQYPDSPVKRERVLQKPQKLSRSQVKNYENN